MNLYRQQMLRDRYLLTVYKMVQGDTIQGVLGEEVMKRIELEKNDADKVAIYLRDELLLKFQTFTSVALTHEGRKEAERLQSLPYEEVEGRVLWMINERCHGSLTKLVSIDEVARMLVIEPREVYQIMTDLDERRGFIKAYNEAVLLLPAGKAAVEELNKPSASSKMSTGVFITQVHGDNYGQIHAGHGGRQTLINQQSVSEILPKLSAFIESIKGADFERRERVIDDLEEIVILAQGKLTPTIWELIQAKFLSAEASMKVAGFVYKSHPYWPAISDFFHQIFK